MTGGNIYSDGLFVNQSFVKLRLETADPYAVKFKLSVRVRGLKSRDVFSPLATTAFAAISDSVVTRYATELQKQPPSIQNVTIQ